MRTVSMSTLRTALARLTLWLALPSILVLATRRPADLPSIEVWDKLLHGGAFFTLAVLADAAYSATPRRRQWLWLMGFGLLIESVQWFLPYRESALDDVLANALGAGAYGLLAFAAGRLWRPGAAPGPTR